MEHIQSFFPKDYFLLEIEKFEVTLKYFLEKGIIQQDDYDYISITLKMIKTFLNTRINIINQNYSSWNDYPKALKKAKKAKTQHPEQPSLFDFTKPIPISGKIEVAGLNERLDALKPRESKAVPKFPFKIGAGTHWNQVIIKFLDDERVEIYVKKFKHTTDYKEMGFTGKGKVPTPSEQWTFLKVLAMCHGEITINDKEAKDQYKKQKQVLTEALQNYFTIDFDPFYPYQSTYEKAGNSYKIKLTLIPPSEKNNLQNTKDNETDELGIQDYLKDEAPEVIDV